MLVRLFRSARADRNRFIALYLSMGFGLLVTATLFVYEARIIIVADGLGDEEAFAVLGTANRVLNGLENAETGQRGYLLTGDESYLQPYQQGVRDLDDTVLRLHQVVVGDQKSVELVRRLQIAKTDKVTELVRTIELARSGNRNAAIALVQTNEGKRYMEGLHSELDLLLDDWRQKWKVAVQEAHQRLFFGTAALAVIAVLVCCLMMYTVFVQRRAFARMHAYSATLDQQATQDALTGLPNRRRLLTALDALGALAEPGFRRTVLLYLDVDGFKSVNDALGHSAGDALLRRLAESLRAATRQNDVLGRVGGDELVLLAPDCSDDGKLRELAGRLVSCVRAVGKNEFGGRFPIGVSIGIATYPASCHRCRSKICVKTWRAANA
ncbi:MULTISPECIES: diguanylate cyclase domain-containing protein [Paraburkholderia]|uniref:Diguanylate cyclase n=1 Tax=Paraburkholderia podalyriae TaxID=1938811 RepID=A0ABR7Q1S4_9BURK|nr:diguanylate cyclase [Paraburkholderia podalyriae]MBC8752500.1 diguanylate cyclase [Paraburkholderia podalyriae]